MNKLNIPNLRVCGKKRHYLRSDAEKERDRIAARDRANRSTTLPPNVYHCKVCGAYHVGRTS